MRSAIIKYKSYIFLVLLAVLCLKVFIPQIGELQDSLSALKTADLFWVVVGLLVFALSIPTTTVQYMALAMKPLAFRLTFRVQMALLFVSKLLPAYLGAISLNVYYLIKERHTVSQAAAIITMDGITSGIAYSLLIILALLTSPLSLNGLVDSINISTTLVLFLVILLLGLCYIGYRSTYIRTRIKKIWTDLKINFASYKNRPWSVVAVTVCNGLSSLTSIFVIYASARAIGVDLSFSGALLAYTFGNIAATLVPTPGGIGAVEAGIYSGLVLVGLDGPDATLITLLYRLVTYWIPILPGYYFFWGLRKNLLADYNLKKDYSTKI